MVYFILGTVALFIVFMLVWKPRKASLNGGYLFCAVALAAAITYALAVISSGNEWLYLTLAGAAILLALVMAFGLYVLIAGLLLNARQMFKRERFSLQNSLTLLLGLLLLVFAVLTFLMGSIDPPAWVRWVWGGLMAVLLLYLFHIFVFLVSVLLCNFARPKKNQDYIIVLGARLVDNKVSPLLGRRVERAVRFYYAQKDKGTPPPKLVMSGGQGSDEQLPEAEAMKAHALEKGVAEEDILMEDRSTNTYENMAFSKALIESREDGAGPTGPHPTGTRPARCIYCTSNYHLLRAGILARRAGIPMDGIGAKTAWYYLPTALLREYVAYFWMHKWRMLATALAAFLLGFCAVGFPSWMVPYIIG